ncbi:ABC transporter substrate-binding protein [Blastococcus haudaquaticus]|uniref:ABC-type nitrate/sulfonate/bicarbonate transport system, substrate-binding protein n=1 Tax=Blastococcus haudaquaticus TaxID=1938745 RepID=A0A286GV99_9ACTN|nr:ABC transporter substrate-binding protein [Blastococcus haudaquaticus]SOD99402.1 ABC-type nitrate/sulfonate/bicarbonate transport system, substrate-binding protein [Blastococcus haudaquaticus]
MPDESAAVRISPNVNVEWKKVASDMVIGRRPTQARSRKGLLALFLAVSMSAVAACGGGDSGDSEGEAQTAPHTGVVRISETGSSEDLALWVAQDEGIFEANGLEVELQNIAAGLAPVALTNGEVQLGTQTAPDFLQAVSSELDLTAVAGMSYNTPENPRLFVVASKASGITSIDGLAGARIGTPSRGGSFEISTTALMEEDGIDTGDVEWVEVPFPQMIEALNSGLVDAVATSINLVGPARAAGHQPVVDLSEFGDDVLITFLSGTTAWVEANGDIVEKLRTSLEQAAEFVTANPERTVEIIAAHTGLDPAIAQRTPPTNLSAAISEDQLQLWIDAMSAQGLIEDDVQPGVLLQP